MADKEFEVRLREVVEQLKAVGYTRYEPSPEVLKAFREGRAKRGWKP